MLFAYLFADELYEGGLRCLPVRRLLEFGEFADTLKNVLLQLPVATRADRVDMAELVGRNDALVHEFGFEGEDRALIHQLAAFG